jgi:hypothetical protein
LPNQTNECGGNIQYNNVFTEMPPLNKKGAKNYDKLAFKRKKIQENQGSIYRQNGWQNEFQFNPAPVINPLMDYQNYLNNYLLYPIWNLENNIVFPNDLFLKFNNMNLEGDYHKKRSKKFFRRTNQFKEG